MAEEEEFDPQTEFLECCRYGDVETGLSLLNSYAEIDACMPDDFGTTPLHAASANGLLPLIEAIIGRPGVNLDVQTPGGNTALHYAALNRHGKVIEALAAAGADVKLKNKQGHSPLVEAVAKFDETNPEETKVVDVLVGKDEDIPKDIQVPAEDDDQINEPDTPDEPDTECND